MQKAVKVSTNRKLTPLLLSINGRYPHLTLSTCDSAHVDLINANITIQWERGLVCKSPSRAIWCVLPASVAAAVRRSTFGRGRNVFPRLHLQPTSDKQSCFFSTLPVSPSQPQKGTHIFPLSLRGLV